MEQDKQVARMDGDAVNQGYGAAGWKRKGEADTDGRRRPLWVSSLSPLPLLPALWVVLVSLCVASGAFLFLLLLRGGASALFPPTLGCWCCLPSSILGAPPFSVILRPILSFQKV